MGLIETVLAAVILFFAIAVWGYVKVTQSENDKWEDDPESEKLRQEQIRLRNEEMKLDIELKKKELAKE